MDVAPNRQQFENMAPNTSAVPVCSLTYQSASCLPQIIFFKSVQPPWQILSSKVLEMEISTMQPQLRLWKGHSSTVRKKKSPECTNGGKNKCGGTVCQEKWRCWQPGKVLLEQLLLASGLKAPRSEAGQHHRVVGVQSSLFPRRADTLAS